MRQRFAFCFVVLLLAGGAAADSSLWGSSGASLDTGLAAYTSDTGGAIYHRTNTSQEGQCVWLCRAVWPDPDQSHVSTRSNGGSTASYARNIYPNAQIDGFGYSPTQPKVGALMCFEASSRYPTTGHVAVVTAIGQGYVDVWESNFYYPLKIDKRRITNFAGLQGYVYGYQSQTPPILQGGAGNGVGQGAPYPQHFIDCYNRNGGSPVVGNPINVGGANADAHAWHSAWVQDFDGGSASRGMIMDYPGTGAGSTAYYIRGRFWDTWLRFGDTSGLGYPTSDRHDWGDAGNPQKAYIQDYANGSLGSCAIIQGRSSPDLLAYPVYGAFWIAYVSWGGINCALAAPIGDPQAISNGSTQLFEHGRIYGSTYGTWPVIDFLPYYESLGGTGSPLGFPTNLPNLADSRFGTHGQLQPFAGGYLFDSPFGTFSLYGSSLVQQWQQAGGLQGFGYPKGHQVTSGGQPAQLFEGGWIYSGGGVPVLHMSAVVESNGATAQIRVTLSNTGQGVAHNVSVQGIQLGASGPNGTWQVGDLVGGNTVQEVFIFTPGFGTKKVSVLASNLISDGATRRVRIKLTKP